MTNLEEFNKVNTEYIRLIKHISDISIPSDNTAYNFTALNVLLSSYLPLIARSLAIIADNMSEEKED